ncbi:MAG: radical SAM protein, partial [Alphaproteobacteria bacterium]|nr:radical SAM protein [Alphaproteobacteria bacterium]
MGVEVLNFGCRLNIAEGEAIRRSWQGNNDALVINSCAVTAEAERQARQAIRRAARALPEREIIVTGCGAEISQARFAAMPEVARIIAKDITAPAYTPLISGASHARAFISIQTGCDHDCTFCIIHVARGASRSARIADVVAACQRVVDQGQREVVLTGVDLTSYDDAGQPLGALVAAILGQVPGLARLRLSSLDCVEIDPALEELLSGEPRLMPHLHLSFQAGDDMILKRMKRRHSAAQAVVLVQRLKAVRPEMTIGADLIAGFPTETQAMFANTLTLVERCDIVFGHVFPFSPR